MRRRGTRVGLVPRGVARHLSAERRRERLRHAVRRGLRALRRPWPDPSSTLDRVGPHRTRVRPPRRRGHRALPRGPDRGPGRRHLTVGVSASLHAPGLVHRGRRGRVPRRPRPLLLLGPPRGVLCRGLRRPGLRVEADQRAVRLRSRELSPRRVPAAPAGSTRHARRLSRRAARGSGTPGGNSAGQAHRSPPCTTFRRSSRSTIPSPRSTTPGPSTS